jgi:DNA-binding XRE family transcriptional regulator
MRVYKYSENPDFFEERNEMIRIAYHKHGMTIAKIAEHWGLSTTRASQIVRTRPKIRQPTKPSANSLINLRKAREAMGWSEMDTARLAGMTTDSYTRMEKGSRRMTAVEALKLCDIFNLTLREIVQTQQPTE